MSKLSVAAFFSGLVPSIRQIDLRYNAFAVLEEAWFAGATDGTVLIGACATYSQVFLFAILHVNIPSQLI
jgi:hypothetical protein